MKEFDLIKKMIKKDLSVSVAYLFGSQVTGKTNKNSDFDIAVFLDKKLNDTERFDKRLELIGGLSRILKTDKIDLVVINDLSSVFFKYVIIKEGKLIYQRKLLERCELEGRIMGEYFDFKPFLDSYNAKFLAT